MKPKWFTVENIPYGSMFPDDHHRYPLLITGKRFTGDFLFDKEGTLLDFSLLEREEL